ncbi:MAG: lysophospholipid acyltransferase family protein [Bacillota bacterium]
MIYRFAWLLCRAILLLLRRWDVRGGEKVPPTGGLIVTANHTSYWDPVIVGCALRRKVHYMAKAELFSFPVFKWLLSALGAFPVRREGIDRAALKKAQEVLAAGEVVGIFPEGTRSRTGELLKPHLGAALLATKNGVPILPVAVIGAPGFGKVRVYIGDPVYPPAPVKNKPSKEQMEAYLDQVMQDIRSLMEDRNGRRS